MITGTSGSWFWFPVRLRYIDEINTANIDFVREVSTRNDYLMATLNPDDPNLPVYKEFINRSRPYKKYEKDVPPEIMTELKEKPVPRWRYWFFTFRDNLSLTPEAIQKKKDAAPPGTKLYKNKILGLRGKATGLIFPNFDRSRHVVTAAWIKRSSSLGGSSSNDSLPDWIHLIPADPRTPLHDLSGHYRRQAADYSG